MKPAEKSRRVLVVGGGPAGLEAARVAALRGHEVTLYEEAPELGGQLPLASQPPHKGLLTNLTSYLARQVLESGVTIELGKKVDPALSAKIEADAIILATGMSPFFPNIKGIDASVLPSEVLRGEVQVGQEVAVIGGGLVGLETALWLAERGKDVTVVEELPEMALAVIPRIRSSLLEALTAKSVQMLTSVKCEEIADNRLLITDSDGRWQTIAADTVVLAAGAIPERELYEKLQRRVPEVYLAGDCVKPGNLFQAIHDGFHIAYGL